MTLSRTILGALIKLNVLMAFLIFALLVATIVAPGPVTRALGVGSATEDGGILFSMRGIMVIGILAAPILHVIYTRLLAIVNTVNAGDPFVIINAERLKTIAWSIASLELMHLVVVVLANRVSVGAQKVDIEWKFPLTQLLTILLLFVLARVFDQGARMRDELEATV